MCAVKFGYIGSNVESLKVHDIEEKSYSPIAQIEGINIQNYSQIKLIKDIAIVCAINNKAGLKYEHNDFIKIGEPTEAALKVLAEKLG